MIGPSSTPKGLAVPRELDALAVREVDHLVSKLLTEIKVPFGSIGTRVIGQLADLKQILSADYNQAQAMPPKPLLKELAQIVETEIKTHPEMWESLNNSRQMLDHFGSVFGPRELELRAEPYRKGAGLALRGFFCRANLGDKSKFVIFVNTAHHPGAVLATLGHELGHFIYGSMVGEKAPMTAFMEGSFSNHLKEEDELFADSLVALSAYSTDLIKKIGSISQIRRSSTENLFERIKDAYELIGPTYNLDLTKSKMAAAWRVRYLTSMTHFFKLRCALYQSAGI